MSCCTTFYILVENYWLCVSELLAPFLCPAWPVYDVVSFQHYLSHQYQSRHRSWYGNVRRVLGSRTRASLASFKPDQERPTLLSSCGVTARCMRCGGAMGALHTARMPSSLPYEDERDARTRSRACLCRHLWPIILDSIFNGSRDMRDRVHYLA